MKRSLTENRSLTLEEAAGIMVYRPYGDSVFVMVDRDDRIWFRGYTWTLVLDRSNGGFLFEGRIERYYEIDTVTSIRDAYGEFYSFVNELGDRIPRDTWLEVKDGADALLERERKRYAMDRRNEYAKDYYLRNRDKILEYKRDYKSRKESEKELT